MSDSSVISVSDDDELRPSTSSSRPTSRSETVTESRSPSRSRSVSRSRSTSRSRSASRSGSPSRSRTPSPTGEKIVDLIPEKLPKKKRCKECNGIEDDNDLPSFNQEEFKLQHPDWKSERHAMELPGMKIEGSDPEDNYFELEDFSIYDAKDHLVHLDSKHLANRKQEFVKEVYFSGTVHPFFDENSKVTILGYPTSGRIKDWWISGYEEGEKMRIGITTEMGYYHLSSSSECYATFFDIIKEKKNTINLVYLTIKSNPDLTYEELIEVLTEKAPDFGIEEFSEQVLLSIGNFIIKQISSYESEATDDERAVLYARAFRNLQLECLSGKNSAQAKQRRKRAEKRKRTEIEEVWSSDSEDSLGGGNRRKKRKRDYHRAREPKLAASLAITTPLVSHFFGSVFGTEMKGALMTGCGDCDSCKRVDCGACDHCTQMTKFGGYKENGSVVCRKRECEEDLIKIDDDNEKAFVRKREKSTNIKFLDEGDEIDERTFYTKVRIDEEEYEIGDYGMTIGSDTGPNLIVQIISIYKERNKKCAHVRFFVGGPETILGEIADPKELFALKHCETIPLYFLLRKVQVEYHAIPKNWNLLGGDPDSIPTPTTNRAGESGIYWYRHLYIYEKGRFEKMPHSLMDYDDTGRSCTTCQYHEDEMNKWDPQVNYNGESFKLENTEYEIGDAVMLQPGTFGLPNSQKRLTVTKVSKDRKEYPEHYRKAKKRNAKGHTRDLVDPFDIGIITKIIDNGSSTVSLKVRILYRPENTKEDWKTFVSKQEVFQLFWSEEFMTIDATRIEGKAFVLPEHKIVEEQPFLWWQKGNYRFFYSSMYEPHSNEFCDLPNEATEYEPASEILDFNEVEPLDTMDVFAGCGGLSIGLEQSGVAKVKWGIEWDSSAAQAFQLNHPEASVINRDVNKVLQEVIESEKSDIQPGGVPRKGEVELLCGGPPCQGFSVLNSFTDRDAARFKNSLISAYLSYCDYYRPKYFILENVRQFANFNKGQVLRLCMGALVRMGYQCQFGVLQAGNYGVPQDRKRAILLAAAPNVKMPNFPAPTHSFNYNSLTISFDGKTFDVNTENWKTPSAPYRFTNVRDGISDLPLVAGDKLMSYRTDCRGTYQKLCRWNEKTGKFKHDVEDHVEKKPSLIVQERLKYIPKHFGSEWTDLPNISVTLPNGVVTQKLKYQYRTPNGHPAVCHCLTGINKRCYEEDRQENTLIPWALSHTGGRHNEWAGLYSRVHYDSYFSTVIRSVHPDGKQGRCLHPDQPRLVSIRECARAQGFHDNVQFAGSLVDRYSQIGNAVPPPLGRALGIAILSAMDSK